MAESKQLYQEVILDHNRKPRNWGALADATHKAEGVNPLCGDHIHLTVKLIDDDVVGAISFEGESCAICKASASMMTMAVKGRRRAEVEQLVQEFRDFDFMSPWEGAEYILPGDEKASPEAPGAPTPLKADEIKK